MKKASCSLTATLCLLLCGCGPTPVPVNDPSLDLDERTTQSEPSFAMAGSTVVVGYNDTGDFDEMNSNVGYAFSYNGGEGFADAGALLPVDGGTNFGDPSLATDRAGNFTSRCSRGIPTTGRSSAWRSRHPWCLKFNSDLPC